MIIWFVGLSCINEKVHARALEIPYGYTMASDDGSSAINLPTQDECLLKIKGILEDHTVWFDQMDKTFTQLEKKTDFERIEKKHDDSLKEGFNRIRESFDAPEEGLFKRRTKRL